jgi:hypothetical protein
MDQYYCALLHFTGNDSFNKYIRFKAQLTGFKLSQNGLIKENESFYFNNFIQKKNLIFTFFLIEGYQNFEKITSEEDTLNSCFIPHGIKL